MFTEESDGIRAHVSIRENVLFFCVEAAVERAPTKRVRVNAIDAG